MNQQKILHVMHNSEQPATVFSILETENKRICVTADTLFDMITGKISELSGAKKAPKAESRGTRFEVAGGDFLIKLGSVTVGQNFKGILCEVEYQPCVIPSNCWELMREFLQGSFGSCVSSQPPAFLQGEKNAGFEVLYQNLKESIQATKELLEFFRERSKLEEATSSHFLKLANKATNGCSHGSFAPMWQVLKATTEKLSSLHTQMVQKIQELVKEAVKYTDELQKRQKSVKDEESGTSDAVQSLQSVTMSLQKAKDAYIQRCLEYERLKSENPSASTKELEKLEGKCRKAQEDYKALVDKYNLLREDFERKMTVSCRHFQEMEVKHLIQLKEFFGSFTSILLTHHDMIGKAHEEQQQQTEELTVDRLLEEFIKNKETGSERPCPAVFEEAPVVGTLVSIGSGSPDPSDRSSLGDKDKEEKEGKEKEKKTSKKEGKKGGSGDKASKEGLQGKPSRRTTSLLNLFNAVNTSSGLGAAASNSGSPDDGFLRSRRKKKKGKQSDMGGNKDDKSDGEEKEEDGGLKADCTHLGSVEVDGEGYSIRPSMDREISDHHSSFFSSSDSDSDDGERMPEKLHIEIKPVTNGSAPEPASVEELKANIENITLSPVGINMSTFSRKRDSIDDHSSVRRSTSVVSSKQGNLSSLDLSFFSSGLGQSGTNTSTPSGSIHSPTNGRTGMDHSLSISHGGMSDAFSNSTDIPPSLPPKVGQGSVAIRSDTPTSSIAIPRPPSRKAEMQGFGTTRGRVSPLTGISRAESTGSLGSGNAIIPVTSTSSRGPSPLTIGMSDTIPLAVAFQELVHAKFRGTDESKCLVQQQGELVMSFPSGIVSVFTSNPMPAPLVFRLSQTNNIDQVVPNKHLLVLSQSELESHVYKFQMGNLVTLLKKQAEENPGAAYFNCGILRYKLKAKPGASSAPFHMVAYWKCEPSHTDLRIDYKYNGIALATPCSLLNLAVSATVDGGVTTMHSKPQGQWLSNSYRGLWRLSELSALSEEGGVGSLRARFDLSHGPGSPGVLACQFACDGSTLSGLGLELVGPGYRLSLVKRKFSAGKKFIFSGANFLFNLCKPVMTSQRQYTWEGEQDQRYRYAAPPGPQMAQSPTAV
ncbi:unnamed protein product [Darwinula stevensoni]|nr:unnamed protein product [Darwinula stevensoni]CAG0879746.1 unnamed protein product [Darwinula stevensoni]